MRRGLIRLIRGIPHPYPIPQTMKDRNLGVVNARDSYVPSSGSLMTRVAWNLLKEEPSF